MSLWLAAILGLTVGLSVSFFLTRKQTNQTNAKAPSNPEQLSTEQQLSDLQAQYDLLKKEYENLQNTVEQDVSTEDERSHSPAQPESSGDAQGQPGQKRAAADIHLESLEHELEDIRSANATLKEKIADLTKELQTKDRGMKKIQQELETVKSSAEAEIRDLQADLAIAGEKYEQILMEFEQQKESLEKRIFSLQTELGLFAENSEVQPIRSELEQAHLQIEKERSAVEMLIRENRELTAKLMALQDTKGPIAPADAGENSIRHTESAVSGGLQ